MKYIIALIFIVSGVAVANGITVYVDGVETDMEITQIHLSSASGPVDPPVDPPDSCPDTPANVKMLAPMDWSKPQPKTLISINRNKTYSSRLKTTSNPDYQGQIGVASVTGGSRFNKRMWFSECPGGEEMASSRCVRQAGESATINWGQDPAMSGRCILDTNTRYYWNVKTLNCDNTSFCNVNRAGVTNGQP